MTTQEKLDEITEFIELFVPEDQERARLNLEHLIDQARNEAVDVYKAQQLVNAGLITNQEIVDAPIVDETDE